MKDPNNTRNTMPRRGSPLWIFFVVVISLGVGAFVATLTRLTATELDALVHMPVILILGAFIVFGELRPIITPGSTENNGATTSTTFSFAALLYAGLPIAAVLQAVAVITCGVFRGRTPHRIAFNVAQYTLSLAAAQLALLACGIHGVPSDPWVPEGRDLPAIALAGAVYFICNDALVGAAVALHERVSLIKALRWDLGYQVLVHLALLGLAPLMVVAMDRSAWFLQLIVLPFIAVYLNASVSVRREHQALHDGLTGLPNRKMLIVRTEEALAEVRGATARRLGGMVGAGRRQQADPVGGRAGLFLLDLDRFKEVNDTLGHPTGDRLLQLVAHRLTHSVRPGDLVARLGGDEFAVLLPTVRDAAAAREVAARLRAALSEPVRLDGLSFDLEASVGIALFPDHAPDFELLLQRADVAMYNAKENRTGVEVYSPDKDRNSPARLGMLGDLRGAIDRGELELYYQPKISLHDGQLVGMEALIRWRHPEQGLLEPDDFLPIAEQTYLMRAITHYVVNAALAQAASWWKEDLAVQVSVNASGRDLLDTGLAEAIEDGLLEHGLPAAALQLEITERILMNETAYASETVGSLAELGIPLSLDDFGTGYSSLVRLKRLPVEELKIDSSFVQRLTATAEDAVIVRSIVDLVRTLGLRSVAEGVEDAQTARLLREMGCDAAQGWHFGRPMDAATATDWLRSVNGFHGLGPSPGGSEPNRESGERDIASRSSL
ncbi:putative bifunctional diguanylate cyclase/phosphodiesterase [Actinomadura rudentiformis]|uniref:Bifunctional diguanylate cyclase/phosphodiesterase n=1 Tax=Actinomadura rudentiformis TaxID=359158 RepID=A0A6H9YAU1_9ACTN|nr:bifunctional diguanylate cyclase/phosphodiesterase [Actinomadura rudentiformis]KAB2342401.1 bifunctional diguanylate cyclase/phosphodiesterase [Actinomadura rudentiformis]